MRIFRLLILVLVFGFLGECAFAETFVVNKTADTFDAVCNADCSIRDAFQAVNAAPTNDEINFDPVLFSTPQTILMEGHLLTLLNNTGSTAINGPGPGLLTISGGKISRIFVINGFVKAIIHGMTIKDGNGFDQGPGGAIVNAGTVTLYNVVIRDSQGDPFGGGIYSNGRMTITDCLITGNTSVLDGGGIFNSGFGTIGDMTITNSYIANNEARGGAGIFNNAVLTIVNSTISDNQANRNDGGGAAGIATDSFGNDNANVTIINSTVSRNVARQSGGGIVNAGCVLNLLNVTISSNIVTQPNFAGGGGISSTSANHPAFVYARNSIIADNSASPSPDFVGVLTSQGYNLIESTQGTVILGDTTGNIIGQDPKLAALNNNGGSTLTCALLPGSPALDAVAVGSPATDQRFFARPADGDGNGSMLGDIGALEMNAPPVSFSVKVSGRVTIQNARSSFPSLVTLTDNSGTVYSTVVNAFGYYHFRDIPAGKTYFFNVKNKLTLLVPKVVFLTADLNNADFVF